MDRTFAAVGALAALLGVALGAFGAHALAGRLGADARAVFETGVRYQMYHALGLLFVAWSVAQRPAPLVNASGWLFVAGIVLFSGSLYALALSGPRYLGAITPLGGLCFLAGWACLAAGALRSR